MTEYELDKFCQKINCNCDCMNCSVFAKYMDSVNNGR